MHHRAQLQDSFSLSNHKSNRRLWQFGVRHNSFALRFWFTQVDICLHFHVHPREKHDTGFLSSILEKLHVLSSCFEGMVRAPAFVLCYPALFYACPTWERFAHGELSAAVTGSC